MTKKYVVKNSWQLGIESAWENEKGKLSPFWYVFNKETKQIIEGTENESKSIAFKIATKMNG